MRPSRLCSVLFPSVINKGDPSYYIQEDYDKLRPLTYSNADVVLLAFTIDDPDSFEHAKDKWSTELRHFLVGVPVLIVGCKGDLRKLAPPLRAEGGFVELEEVSFRSMVCAFYFVPLFLS